MAFAPTHIIILIIILIITLSVVLPFMKIFKKAGFPSALGVLMIVPLVHFIMLFFLAFSEWPALRKSEQREE
jgi:branched-subunit amino acid transport protein AzlD